MKEGMKNKLVQRTSAGLRDALFDELDLLRSGTSNPSRANAVAKLADQVINTVTMELEVQRHINRMPLDSKPVMGLPTPIALGA